MVGSGCSASLALYIGSNNPELVASVLAFSPSDCFNGTLDTKNVFSKCPIPVLVASSRSEAVATKNFVATIPQSKLTLFSPSTDGAHGTAALLTATPDHHDYWISILLYIRQVQT